MENFIINQFKKLAQIINIISRPGKFKPYIFLLIILAPSLIWDYFYKDSDFISGLAYMVLCLGISFLLFFGFIHSKHSSLLLKTFFKSSLTPIEILKNFKAKSFIYLITIFMFYILICFSMAITGIVIVFNINFSFNFITYSLYFLILFLSITWFLYHICLTKIELDYIKELLNFCTSVNASILLTISIITSKDDLLKISITSLGCAYSWINYFIAKIQNQRTLKENKVNSEDENIHYYLE
ncbi:hypothetical protein [Clostridium sp. 'White wine YQ']|uniref:hypothetical protein n=1 Tax=Clostridium sp. 'White wine YQ' TaxID=3027474 RepID=UPI0023650DF6|nr:hypothetical protein [Clostridium sp. 'White wine YQ']MDD7793658.1 hypothetical protein [Clostridium sp. 'White wine YQ']